MAGVWPLTVPHLRLVTVPLLALLASLFTVHVVLPAGTSNEDPVSNYNRDPAFDAWLDEKQSHDAWRNSPTNHAGRHLQEPTAYNKNYSSLKASLLKGYEKDTPPLHGNGSRLDAVRLRLQVALNSLAQIDTLTQTVKTSAWFRHYWHDARLSWKPSQWGGISFVTFKGTGNDRQVWAPDAVVFEALESSMIIEESDVTVYSDGSVFFSLPMVHTISCPMTLEDFPFDTQTCAFKFGSWSFSGEIVDVNARGKGVDGAVDLSGFAQPNDFILESMHAKRHITYYSCCPEPYPILSFTFVIKRQPLMYTCGIILPMVLVTCMGFMAFMLNPSSGERIGLSITVMLTTVAVYLVANEAIPPIDTYTVVTHLYLMSLIENAFVMFVSIFVVSLHNVRNSEGLESEAALLAIFVKADGNNTGLLNVLELQTFVRNIGLTPERMEEVFKHIEVNSNHTISFHEWYDIVTKVAVPDGLSSTHCFLYSLLIRPFLTCERRLRKAVILRRYTENAELKKEIERITSREIIEPRAAPSGVSIGAKAEVNKQGVAPETIAFGPAAASAPNLLSYPAGMATPGLLPRGQQKPVQANPNEVPPETSVDLEDAQPLVPKKQKKHATKIEIITEREIADPTEIVARRASGLIDQTMSILVPLAYLLVVVAALYGHDMWTLPSHKPVASFVDYT